ncbi:MAG TPA: hypothetical protein VGL18_04205 [Actinomycetota bacterium]
MIDDMRKYVRIGLEALSAQGPEDVAGAVRSRAQVVAEQLSTLAAGFLEWSAEARASLLQELKDLVARQVEEMGVARKKDLDGLRSRLQRLEARLNAQAASSGGAGRAKSTSRAKAGSSARTARSKAARSSPGRTGAGRRRVSRGPR